MNCEKSRIEARILAGRLLMWPRREMMGGWNRVVEVERNEWNLCDILVPFAYMGNTVRGKSTEGQSDQGVKHEAETGEAGGLEKWTAAVRSLDIILRVTGKY